MPQLVFRIVHYCPAYRIEHVGRLTLRQFNLLQQEIDRFEAGRLVIETQSRRIAYHGDRSHYERFLTPFKSALRQHRRRDVKRRAVEGDLKHVTTANAEDFGLTVEKKDDAR